MPLKVYKKYLFFSSILHCSLSAHGCPSNINFSSKLDLFLNTCSALVLSHDLQHLNVNEATLGASLGNQLELG